MKNLSVMCVKCSEPARYRVKGGAVTASHHGETERAEIHFLKFDTEHKLTLNFFRGDGLVTLVSNRQDAFATQYFPLAGFAPPVIASSYVL